MKRQLLFVACALAVASSAAAQTKISGSIDCNKSDPYHAIPIPDRPNFAYAIGQNKCTWAKGSPVEGLQPKEFINTTFAEAIGASARSTASGVTRYDNGDQLFTRSTGTNDLKALTGSGKWTITRGSGKLSGLKGGGTYTCKMKGAEPGSGYTCDIEGEYTPAAKK